MFLVKRKKIIIISLILFILIFLYWFFSHTSRGKSVIVYVIGGWGAPLQDRWSCVKKTEKQVSKKFSLPLAFDKKSKDRLKEFWYFSYYRQCLFANGYDFKGKIIPKSYLAKNQTNYTYANSYASINFAMPANNAVLILDNQLDVDFDNRLHISELQVDEEKIFIHVYTGHEDFSTFSDIELKLENLSTTKGEIIGRAKNQSRSGINLLRVKQQDGFGGIVFLTPNKRIIHIFGSESAQSIIDQIAQSVN